MTQARTDALLDWYRRDHRDFPWRNTTDPYRILVSEVMLQQTQASRVVAHYERFLDLFPSVEELAAARLGDVLRAWSGLGYNNRARRLHETAQRVSTLGWPRTAADLEALPGLGPYTAAAVASFAFGEPVAAIDTNVRRVLSRWYGEPLTGAALRRSATTVLPPGAAATWNQALMDLGARVCRPRRPSCQTCPVAGWCSGPETYVAPPRQARFEGSVRQVRGAILRMLATGPQDRDALAVSCGSDRVDEALAALQEDGLIVRSRSRYTLP